ncbi:MAG: hypothetical protein E6K06_02100 [Methanobacteriota archaeon]|nr:MAG: hypothetical protein E6K06_02100 [Euryarchaeota archaeon]
MEAPGPAAPPPGYAPYPTPPPLPPRRVSMNTLVLLSGILLGALVFVGTLSFHAVFLIPFPGTPPPTDPAVAAYRDTLRILGWTSAVAMDLALGFSLTIAWIAGVSKGEISDGTKRGMFIFATVFLAVWLVFSFSIYSIFRVLIFF